MTTPSVPAGSVPTESVPTVPTPTDAATHRIPTLSRRRTIAALLALALGGFGIGATEFAAMGLLPDIAADLVPGLLATDPDAAIGLTGWVITAYALGVVVGAPTIAAVAGRFARRGLLVALAVAFTLATLATAALPTIEGVIAARFIAGLPHGAYFGVAALVAAELMGPGKRGQGVALVLAGLTVSTVIGVPIITAVGQAAGWRAAYLLVAAVFGATILAVRILVPAVAGDPNSTIRRELAAFARPQVWIAVSVGAIGFGGFFAVYSYIAPLATEEAGFSAAAVPWLLASTGVGMTLGNLLGGRLADGGATRAVFIAFAGLAAALTLTGLAGGTPAGAAIGTFAVGFTAAALSPIIQTRLMDVAGDSQTLAAALNHSALNLGNALGAFLGGLVVVAGFGYLAPAWVGLVLAAIGAGFALLSVLVDRRSATITP